jgi:murein DD-endopeptidase MepM/ murein hydrolase activator NlpD
MLDKDISIIIIPHSSEKKINIRIKQGLFRFLIILFSLLTLAFSGVVCTFVYNYLDMEDFIEPAKVKLENLMVKKEDLTEKLDASLQREGKLKEKVKKERTRYADVLSEISTKMEQLDKFYNDLRIMAGFKLDEDDAKTLQNSIDHEKLGDNTGGPSENRNYLNSLFIHSLSEEVFFEKISEKEYGILVEQKKCMDNMMLLRNMLEDRQSKLADTPKLIPVFGTITSPFGVKRGNGTHSGIDIAAPTGTPIVAPADGVVIKAGTASSYGRVIIIDHGNGYTTRYGHLSGFNCYTGDRISAGDIIGYVGSTGNSSGPHLHYEVRINGIPVDPIRYMQQDGLTFGEQKELSDELEGGIDLNLEESEDEVLEDVEEESMKEEEVSKEDTEKAETDEIIEGSKPDPEKEID